MDDAAGQIGVLVVIARGILVEGGVVQDLEGARAASTEDTATFQTAGHDVVAHGKRKNLSHSLG